MSTPVAPPIRPPAPQPIFMIGGGNKEVTESDLAPITFTVRVNIDCKNDEREVTAVVPLYEHPLLMRMWRRTGGDAKITADWLPSAAKYPRVCKLSRDNLRDEIKRLSETYKVHNPNGSVTNFFEKVYGLAGDPVRGFYRVINEQVRAWHKLQDRIRSGHKMLPEDLLEIANIAEPEAATISPDTTNDFSDVTIDDGKLAEPPVEGTFADDPLDDLRTFLFEREWDPSIVMDLLKMLGDGEKVSPVKVNTLPSLHGKKSEQARLVADYRAFLAAGEKKVMAAKNREAEQSIEPATN
jgi:hypothetical protein